MPDLAHKLANLAESWRCSHWGSNVECVSRQGDRAWNRRELLLSCWCSAFPEYFLKLLLVPWFSTSKDIARHYCDRFQQYEGRAIAFCLSSPKAGIPQILNT